MSDLLDEITKLLAYVGDEGAKDGYFCVQTIQISQFIQFPFAMNI